MASIKLKSFVGMIATTDTKDLPDSACVEMKNMIISPHLYKTRPGCVKLSNTPFSEGQINLIFNLERKPSGNKTIICAGHKLYYV